MPDPQPPNPTPQPDDRIARRLECAVVFARAAGDLTLQYFQSDRFQVHTKRDGTAVTTADRAAEDLLRSLITREFPDDAIVGEEFGERDGTSGFRWILDPIDGTASFVCGVPLYGTLVAVERGNDVVVGVVHMPALDEMVYARAGGGAWHVHARGEAKPARVSGVRSLKDAVVCITGWEYFAKTGRGDFLPKLGTCVGKLRGWSDCYAHVLVATGRVDAVVEPLVHVWDVAPAVVVMREAGGRFSDFSGRESPRSGDGLLSNAQVHSALLDLLSQGERVPGEQ
ncbi:MAG: inositol monophosphatase family protein [Phycisphaerales bacterium]